MKDMFIHRSAAVKVNFSTVSISYSTHDTAQNDNKPYHFCAKNEYIDGQFLAGGCGSRQRQVADGADVVFTDTPYIRCFVAPVGELVCCSSCAVNPKIQQPDFDNKSLCTNVSVKLVHNFVHSSKLINLINFNLFTN